MTLTLPRRAVVDPDELSATASVLPASSDPTHPARSEVEAEWLRKLNWGLFETLVESAFARDGFEVLPVPSPVAGRADMLLRRREEQYLVQCKHWKAWQVGTSAVSEMQDLVGDHGFSNGIVITAGKFSPEATELARRSELLLLDGDDLLQMAAGSPVLPLAAETSSQWAFPKGWSAYGAPTCPLCDAPMLYKRVRAGEHAGMRFWGCRDYPTCRAIREVGPSYQGLPLERPVPAPVQLTTAPDDRNLLVAPTSEADEDGRDAEQSSPALPGASMGLPTAPQIAAVSAPPMPLPAAPATVAALPTAPTPIAAPDPVVLAEAPVLIPAPAPAALAEAPVLAAPPAPVVLTEAAAATPVSTALPALAAEQAPVVIEVPPMVAPPAQGWAEEPISAPADAVLQPPQHSLSEALAARRQPAVAEQPASEPPAPVEPPMAFELPAPVEPLTTFEPPIPVPPTAVEPPGALEVTAPVNADPSRPSPSPVEVVIGPVADDSYAVMLAHPTWADPRDEDEMPSFVPEEHSPYQWPTSADLVEEDRGQIAWPESAPEPVAEVEIVEPARGASRRRQLMMIGAVLAIAAVLTVGVAVLIPAVMSAMKLVLH